MISIKQNSLEVQQLCSCDTQLGTVIKYIGEINIPTRDDYFVSLVKSIIGQQLSAKAAHTLINRFENYFNNFVTPEAISLVNDDSLKSLGLSKQKVSYIRDLTKHVLYKKINLNDLQLLNDEDVIERLTVVKGVGIWTAEMFLIFSLKRMNVLSLGDIGLQRAAKWLYNLPEVNGKKLLEDKSKLWEPHKTISSLYLWEIINSGLINNDVGEISIIGE